MCDAIRGLKKTFLESKNPKVVQSKDNKASPGI